MVAGPLKRFVSQRTSGGYRVRGCPWCRAVVGGGGESGRDAGGSGWERRAGMQWSPLNTSFHSGQVVAAESGGCPGKGAGMEAVEVGGESGGSGDSGAQAQVGAGAAGEREGVLVCSREGEKGEAVRLSW